MAYSNMKEILEKARKGHYAIPAFNIVNYLTAQAIVDVAEELSSPVILQTSASTAKQFGIYKLSEMLIPIAKRAEVPVVIHLDHCSDTQFIKECIDAGWSSVMIDASTYSLEENIRLTKEVVEYAKDKGVTVEGELGSIVGVEDDIAVEEGKQRLADVDNCRTYLEATNIDAFAPAIGTAHGLYKGEPKLDFHLLEQIKKISLCPLVIHGGTGLASEVFKKLISLGGTKINISTAVKITYCESISEYINEHPNENNPLKLDKYATEKVKQLSSEYIKIFGSENHA